MKHPSAVFAALGDLTRWRLALLLRGRDVCVCELMDVLKMPQSSLSSHLKVLREAGLVDSARREKWAYYRLTSTAEALVEAMQGCQPAAAARIKSEAGDLARLGKRIALRGQACSPKGQRRAIPPPLDAPAPCKG